MHGHMNVKFVSYLSNVIHVLQQSQTQIYGLLKSLLSHKITCPVIPYDLFVILFSIPSVPQTGRICE